MGFIKKVLLVIAFIGVFGLGTFVENKLGIFEPGFDFVSGLFGDKYSLEEAVAILNDESTLENFSVDLELDVKMTMLDPETDKKVTESLNVSAGVDVIIDMEDTMLMQVMIDLSFSSKGESTTAMLDLMLSNIESGYGFDLSKGASAYLELNVMEVMGYAMGDETATLDSVKGAIKTTGDWEDQTTEVVGLVEALIAQLGEGDLESVTEGGTTPEGETTPEEETGLVSTDMFKENDKGTYDIVGMEDSGVVLSLKKGISLVSTEVVGDYDTDGFETTTTMTATLSNFGKVTINAPIAS